MLAQLVVDWYAFGQSKKQKAETLKTERRKEEIAKSDHVTTRPLTSVIRRLSSVVRHPSALAARCEAIPDELVRAFPFRSLLWKWHVRRLAAQGRSYEAYAQTDASFASAVAQCKLPPHDVFFGYSYASLEMLEAEKRRGKLTIVDQIDPGPVEFRLVAEEMQRHPELAGPPQAFPAAYYERNRREWELTDVIVVNSEWTQEAIITEGADPAKIEILPLAFEADKETTGPRDHRTTGPEARSRKTVVGGQSSCSPAVSGQWSSSPRGSALRVLWLGQVNVRKGIHYLMEAARLLEGEKVHFDVVGPMGVLPGTIASTPRNMTFHGPVSRDGAAESYRQSDVFVLPTLSDGFAITQLEALAHGLPVITTPNCGRVVEDGVTGFIVPPGDTPALAAAIVRFVGSRAMAPEMAHLCRKAAAGFSISAYGQGLEELVRRRLAARLS